MISIYEKGELKQTKNFDNEGKEVQKNNDQEVYLTVEEMPEYPGGTTAMIKFISANIEYPTESVKNRSDGRVLVSFIINKEGEVTDVEVIKSIDFYIDNEAMRVIKKMPKWKPGIQNQKPVAVKFTVPIAFKQNPISEYNLGKKVGSVFCKFVGMAFPIPFDAPFKVPLYYQAT